MNIESAHTVASLRRAILPLAEQHPWGRAALGHEEADHRLCGGLLRGAQHEVFAQTGHAPAAIGFAALLAARVAEKKTLIWIRQDYSCLEHGEISANGILELGLDPKRLLLMRAADAKDALRACADALSCASLGAVILELPSNPRLLDLTLSRRLTLACAHKGVTAILLRLDAKIQTSAAETRWCVAGTPSLSADSAPRFSAELVRNRHGALGHWIMEWDANHGRFFTRAAADTRAVAQTAFDRQNPPAAIPFKSVFAKAPTVHGTRLTRRSFSAGGRTG